MDSDIATGGLFFFIEHINSTGCGFGYFLVYSLIICGEKADHVTNVIK